VKGNRPELYEDIKDCFEGLETGEIRERSAGTGESGWEKGHGRIEKREARAVTDTGWLEGKGAWKDLNPIIEYRYRGTTDGETVKTDRYYISGAKMSAEAFCRCLRGHWPVENKPRWSLDDIFREDAAQAGKGHAPCEPEYPAKNSACPPSGSPRPSGKKKMTGHKRRFTAAMNPDYMFTVLFKK
jgi:hypothetical protein